MGLDSSIESLKNSDIEDKDRLIKNVQELFEKEKLNFDPKNWELLQNWKDKKEAFENPVYEFKVRDKVLKMKTHTESLSHSQIPKVASPNYRSWGDILKWILQENFPWRFSLYGWIISIQKGRRGSYKNVCRRRWPRKNK